MKLAHKNEFVSQGKNPNFQIEEFFLRKVVRIPMIKRLGATAVGSIRTGGLTIIKLAMVDIIITYFTKKLAAWPKIEA